MKALTTRQQINSTLDALNDDLSLTYQDTGFIDTYEWMTGGYISMKDTRGGTSSLVHTGPKLADILAGAEAVATAVKSLMSQNQKVSVHAVRNALVNI